MNYGICKKCGTILKLTFMELHDGIPHPHIYCPKCDLDE